MGYLRLSFTEHRRARLTKKVDRLDRLEEPGIPSRNPSVSLG